LPDRSAHSAGILSAAKDSQRGALRPLIEAIGAAPVEKRAEAEAKLGALKQEAAKGKDAKDDRRTARAVRVGRTTLDVLRA
jgi:hypothetical protein